MLTALGNYSPGALLLRQAGQLIWPRRCPLCRRVLGWQAECPDCAFALRRLARRQGKGPCLPPPGLENGAVTWAAAAYWYDGEIRRALLQTKYRSEPWTAVQLGCLMAERLFGAEVRVKWGVEVPALPQAPLIDCDLLVPMPSSGRGRGYNVPSLLCRPLSRALGIPVEERAVIRLRRGTPQVQLSREERLLNPVGLFSADAHSVAGRRVLLVDDVLTTGGTSGSCARALLDAGAEQVAVAAFATPWENLGLPAQPGRPFDLEADPEVL